MTAQTNEDDIQLLSQYVDGELPAAESRALEARLHSEQSLRETLVQLEELNHRLRDMMAERDGVPESLSSLLSGDGNTNSTRDSTRDTTRDDFGGSGGFGESATVLPFPGASAAANRKTQPRWAYAMAASVAAAVALSMVFNTENSNPLPGNDRIVSATLDTQASGADWVELGDGRELRTVLTFPHEDGRWCREYLLRGGDADWRAVACRDTNRWVTQAAGLESFLDSADAYRAAGAEDSEPVAVFINQHAADIALGAQQEQALMEAGWR